MKSKLISVCVCVASISGCAFTVEPDREEPDELGDTQAELARNALTKQQESTTLKLIDDICGDTWCSGDYNFAFRHLTCRAPEEAGRRAGTCTLNLRIIPREGVDTTRPYYARSCTTPNFRTIQSLISTAPNGYQALQPAYYSALTECIGRLETRLPH